MVQRWDIITIGNLSRNRYWGESDDHPYRPAICTCTLISGADFRLLVDPSLVDGERMAAELDRRTGLTPDQISAVFITHEHGDHHAGLIHFSSARWFAAPPVAERLNQLGRYLRDVEPVGPTLFDCIDVLPTPGHTASHHSLRFDCENFSVIVAGDAVMNRDFWRDRRGYFNSVDPEAVAETMDTLSSIADAIVPGHDNWFLNLNLTEAPEA